MAWKILNVSLAIDQTEIACQGGKAIATVTVTGKTDDQTVTNHYDASLRDDHVIPDILWSSGSKPVGPGQSIKQEYEVELWCDEKCRLVGPAGSSNEKTAEVYAHVAGREVESQSNDIAVSCILNWQPTG